MKGKGILSHYKNGKIRGADCHESNVFRRQFLLWSLNKLIVFLLTEAQTRPRLLRQHTLDSLKVRHPLVEILQLVRHLYCTSQLLPRSAGMQQKNIYIPLPSKQASSTNIRVLQS